MKTKTFATALRALIKKHGKTTLQVAAEAGLAVNTVKNVLAGNPIQHGTFALLDAWIKKIEGGGHGSK